MVDSARLAGRRIAVIGAALGQIGGSIVQRLGSEGASVVVGGRNPAHLDAVADASAGAVKRPDLVVDGGVSAVYVPAPVSDDDFYPRYPFSKQELGLHNRDAR